MKVCDLVFEIGTEEIPASYAVWALSEVKRLAEEEFKASRIPFSSMESYGTPRRLVLIVKDVPERQENLYEEHRGPTWNQAYDANGNPTKAAYGFARGKGVPLESLRVKDYNGTQYVVSVIEREGRPITEVLPEVLVHITKGLVFPKNMYWDDPALRFARPIRWILCLWGESVIPFEIGRSSSGRVTRGHRFMGAKGIEIRTADEYMDKLYDNYVIVDHNKRREKMLSGISAIGKELAATVDAQPRLVEENCFLVEYPVPFYGSFDKAFLELPEEVLTTVMVHHQRYMPVRGSDGKLKPYFVGISNNRATEMGVVVDGNERVLRARFADAAFFWEKDLERPLSNRVADLKHIVYQEQLGSLYDKTLRIRQLSLWLCEALGKNEAKELVERAAYLSKADLVTQMVYEFPELRGVMGREYARRNGEPDAIARALYEQYLPAYAGDRLPSDVVGAIVGIADRVDSIVSCFKVGLVPTGSQDPYGLRRAARCVAEVIWGLALDVDLKEAVRQAGTLVEASDEVIEGVYDFLRQRLYVQMRERRDDHSSVALAVSIAWHRPLQALLLLERLFALKDEEWFEDLVTSAVRVRNILTKAPSFSAKLEEGDLKLEAERELYEAVKEINPLVNDCLRECDWEGLMKLLSRLSPVISRFFDEVFVMSEDAQERQSRLSLLSLCNDLFRTLGDLGSLKGSKEAATRGQDSE